MPDERPIVERPNIEEIRRWHGYNYRWGQEDMEHMADYIEQLEAKNSVLKGIVSEYQKVPRKTRNRRGL